MDHIRGGLVGSVVQGLLGRTTFQVLVLLGLLLVLLSVRWLRSRGRFGAARTVAGGALAVTVVGVLALTLRPFAPPGAVDPVLVLDPVAGAWGWDRIAWGPVLDNIALFVPVGALAVATWWRRSPVLVWLGCVLLSVAIEAMQYLVPTGRVANTADILANSTGALVGVLFALALRVRAVPRRPGSPPRVTSGAR